MMPLKFIFYTVLFYIMFSFVKRFLKSFSNYSQAEKRKREPPAEEAQKYKNAIDADFEEIKDK